MGAQASLLASSLKAAEKAFDYKKYIVIKRLFRVITLMQARGLRSKLFSDGICLSHKIGDDRANFAVAVIFA